MNMRGKSILSRGSNRGSRKLVWNRVSCVSTTCIKSRARKRLWVWNYDLFLEYRDLSGNESREAEGDLMYSMIRI